jgi:hypothetical protein
VNYSGVCPEKPEGEELESIAPGAPDQGALRFLFPLCF